MRLRRVSRICDTGYIPLPRSLTRSARTFDCGEQYGHNIGKIPNRGRFRKRNLKYVKALVAVVAL